MEATVAESWRRMSEATTSSAASAAGAKRLQLKHMKLAVRCVVVRHKHSQNPPHCKCCYKKKPTKQRQSKPSKPNK